MTDLLEDLVRRVAALEALDNRRTSIETPIKSVGAAPGSGVSGRFYVGAQSTGFFTTRRITLATTAVDNLLDISNSFPGGVCVVFILDETTGYNAIYMTAGGGWVASEIADPFGAYTPDSATTPANTHIYHDGSATYKICNRYAVSHTYTIMIFGA